MLIYMNKNSELKKFNYICFCYREKIEYAGVLNAKKIKEKGISIYEIKIQFTVHNDILYIIINKSQ